MSCTMLTLHLMHDKRKLEIIGDSIDYSLLMMIINVTKNCIQSYCSYINS